MSKVTNEALIAELSERSRRVGECDEGLGNLLGRAAAALEAATLHMQPETVDELDISAWAAFKNHAIPMSVCRHIAESVNKRTQQAPSVDTAGADKEGRLATEVAYLEEVADGAWGDGPMARGAARDRLSALHARAEQPKEAPSVAVVDELWGDMEIAPKDGEQVLLEYTSDGKLYYCVSRWNNDHWRGYPATDFNRWSRPFPFARAEQPKEAPSVTVGEVPSTAARFARLYGIVSRILWLDVGVPANDNPQTKKALDELTEFLFADGIDAALAAAPSKEGR